jgi:hypothetical protein
MAPLPPTPSGVIRTRLLFTLEEATGIGMHFDMAYTGSAPNTAALAALGPQIESSYGTNLVAMATPSVVLTDIICYDLANPSTPEGLTAVGTPGTRSGDTLPASVCAVVNRHIARRYRGARPKLFTPFGSNSDTSGNQGWSTDFTEALTTAWAGFEAGVVGSGSGGTTISAPVGVSFFHGFTVVTSPTTGRSRNVPTPRDPPLVEAVTSYSVTAHFGSQRRRNVEP